jgi:hypothetical protein
VTRFQGTFCQFFGPDFPTCSALSNWITPSTSNAFLATLAFPTGGSGFGWLSYWDDRASANGNLTLAFARLSTQGVGGGFVANHSGASQVPCPFSNGYWGDYDQMTVHNDGVAPVLIRYVTDSTAGACNAGVPQHVSGTLWAP